MEVVLFFFLLIVFLVVVVALIFGSKATAELKQEVAKLSARVANLEATVAVQKEEIRVLKGQISDRPAGLPIEQIIGGLGLMRQKGLVPGLLAIGTTLFQAYWKSKRTGRKPNVPSIEEKRK